MQIKAFISYSWDSAEHREWVHKLADDLEEIDEVHVTWDGYDLDSLTDKNLFMESGIAEADFVVVVATVNYKGKADQRQGGVGIETYLAAIGHWDGLSKAKRTKILLAIREKESVPRYLEGHLYIDFTVDADYRQSLNKLIGHLKGSSRIPRPPKRKALVAEEGSYSFTRIEDLIKTGSKNRRVIVNAVQGTDFAGGKKIKYEIWETRSPVTTHFLALANNINIGQTVRHAIDQLVSARIVPESLTVLRPQSGESVVPLLTEIGVTSRVYELTYKDYIWEFCIDDVLKGSHAPSEVPNYTDQSLSIDAPDGVDAADPQPQALEYMLDRLQRRSTAAAHLVVAPGGMGKTSLCLSVAAKLHNRNDLHSSVVLIQAEAVKKYVADQGLPFARIDSIYHLYELYARVQSYNQVFDRVLFDLSVLCGNLIVLIDGLDEFISLFQDRFDVTQFFRSLALLHEQLGSSSVILTSRNSLLVEGENLGEFNIKRYELLGFDDASVEKYLKRRFKGLINSGDLVRRVCTQIEKVRLQDSEERIVPFFADIAATVAEDELKERRGRGFDVVTDPTPYPSNNELTDHIIHSVLRREETRHGLDMAVTDVVELLSGLVVDFGKRWRAAELRERLALLYDARGELLFSKIVLNPLLVQKRDDLELRYSFLSSYLEVCFVISGIEKQSVEIELSRSLARLASEGNEFRDVRRYFLPRLVALRDAVVSLVPRLRSVLADDDSDRTDVERVRRAIAKLLSLWASVSGSAGRELMDELLEIYGVSRNASGAAALEGLFIFGEFPALDFSGITVLKSEFRSYRRLLSSKLVDCRFMFSKFEGCAVDADSPSGSFSPAIFDATCDLGDLRDALERSKAGANEEAKLVETEAKKLLHSFFKGDRFADNNRRHVRFSTRVPGLEEREFDSLLAAGYIVVKTEKSTDTYYEIAPLFRESVRKLLMDNYPDAKMKEFLKFVRR